MNWCSRIWERGACFDFQSKLSIIVWSTTTPSESSPPASVVRTALLDAADVDATGVVRAHTVIDTSEPPNTSVSHWLQVSLGLDAAIALGSLRSRVPGFRFYFDPLAPLSDGR